MPEGRGSGFTATFFGNPIYLELPPEPSAISPVWAWSFRFPNLVSDILRPYRGG
jgi:hypothetical protein